MVKAWQVTLARECRRRAGVRLIRLSAPARSLVIDAAGETHKLLEVSA